MCLDWQDGINQINKAVEKITEQKEWEMWLTLYPDMDKNNFMSFEKFRQKGKRQSVENNTSDEDILKKVAEIKRVHQMKLRGGE
ncbi:MAG: hypothetical protein RLZZ577_106 [Bacteroidota bacterium]|jgi:predicted flavoprotein YhiN